MPVISIMIPAMIYLLGMAARVVIGTSLVMILAVSAAATLIHAMTTQSVDIVLAGLLLLGGVIGAQYGAMLTTRIKPDLLRLARRMLVVVVEAGLADADHGVLGREPVGDQQPLGTAGEQPGAPAEARGLLEHLVRERAQLEHGAGQVGRAGARLAGREEDELGVVAALMLWRWSRRDALGLLSAQSLRAAR